MSDFSRALRPLPSLVLVAIGIGIVTWIYSPRDENGNGEANEARLDSDLTPQVAAESREGVAAVVLMDVSGSMADPVGADASGETKIDVARRAALDVIRQFDDYGKAHPAEPALVGLFEFSEREGSASTREVIPLSAPNLERARAALDGMRAAGGTPIGDAMVFGKRQLDRTGLTRRHLLVVTDGANTDGFEPESVMTALGRRPEIERPSVYFVAFDIDGSVFNRVRDAGALVLAAANADELNATLNALLTGKILVEGP